jgi:hypothetical protein
MNPNVYEHSLAYDLIVHATDGLEHIADEYDLEAAVIAVLATAFEIASKRKLPPIYELERSIK